MVLVLPYLFYYAMGLIQPLDCPHNELLEMQGGRKRRDHVFHPPSSPCRRLLMRFIVVNRRAVLVACRFRIPHGPERQRFLCCPHTILATTTDISPFDLRAGIRNSNNQLQDSAMTFCVYDFSGTQEPTITPYA